MLIEEIMIPSKCSCKPLTDGLTAAQMMWDHDLGCLPVMDEESCLEGVVTARDLFFVAGITDRRPSELLVAEVMQKGPICTPHDSVRSALITMARQSLPQLPVIDEASRLLGQISIDAVVACTGKDDDEFPCEYLVHVLSAICANSARATTVADFLKELEKGHEGFGTTRIRNAGAANGNRH